MSYETPKIDWVSSDSLSHTALNRCGGNQVALKTSIDDTSDNIAKILEDNEEWGGSKTFTGAVITDNILLNNNAQGMGDIKIFETEIELGDWDMSSSFAQRKDISLPTDISGANIRFLSVTLRKDADVLISDANYYTNFVYKYYSLFDGTASKTEATVTYNNKKVYIVRRDFGLFCTSQYDAVNYNRGWIYIVYVERI